MRKILLALLALAAVVGLAATALLSRPSEPSPLVKLREKYGRKAKASVDHSLFQQLDRKFGRPQDITAACISCHNGRHKEVMASTHWSWERTEYVEGKGIREVGKRNVLNNFCIGVSGSQRSCDKCHIGYGWADASFDLKDPLNVDCLACHDNTGTYVKAAGAAGMPDPSIDLTNVARHVGKPQRSNCGTCHFFGGGGNNVKHGDLEKSMFDPSRDVDVHMATTGPDMQCVDCHTAEKHQMLGKMYSVSSMNRDRVACETCHTALPHDDDVLNEHTYKVSCQACHIPTYAKVNPTKLTWDWSTAGKLKDGKPYEEEDARGDHVYMSIKGTFTWGKNLEPEYIWFNGTATHYLLGEKLGEARPVVLNELHGSYDDPDARIVPVKVHRAKQIYDTQSNILIQPKLYSSRPGDGGFWAEFDWTKASAQGMKEVGLPYSGQHGFVDTVMYWPVNHMVSTKEKAVSCEECHARQGGRLDKLRSFYMPGRDTNRWVDGLGFGMLALTLVGVVAHGGGRLFVARRGKGGE